MLLQLIKHPTFLGLNSKTQICNITEKLLAFPQSALHHFKINQATHRVCLGLGTCYVIKTVIFTWNDKLCGKPWSFHHICLFNVLILYFLIEPHRSSEHGSLYGSVPQRLSPDLALVWRLACQRGTGHPGAISQRLHAALQPQAFPEAKDPGTVSFANRRPKSVSLLKMFLIICIWFNISAALCTVSISITIRNKLWVQC